MIVWDEDNHIAYEMYGVTRPSDPTVFPNASNIELPHIDGLWHAAQETIWRMNTDAFRTLGETSADAAGLSILAGLARPDEGLPIAQGGQGVINHALRVTLPASDINPQYIYPGSHMVAVAQGPNQLPLGARLRLANTPAINSVINNMPPESQIVARAMQQYGLIVADNAPIFGYGTSAKTAADKFTYTSSFVPVSISGQVFEDLNGDGVPQAGEPGLQGWTVQLVDVSLNIAGSAVTAVNGNYTIPSIGPGSFTLREVSPAGYVQTAPAPPGTYRFVTSSGVDMI